MIHLELDQLWIQLEVLLKSLTDTNDGEDDDSDGQQIINLEFKRIYDGSGYGATNVQVILLFLDNWLAGRNCGHLKHIRTLKL